MLRHLVQADLAAAHIIDTSDTAVGSAEAGKRGIGTGAVVVVVGFAAVAAGVEVAVQNHTATDRKWAGAAEAGRHRPSTVIAGSYTQSTTVAVAVVGAGKAVDVVAVRTGSAGSIEADVEEVAVGAECSVPMMHMVGLPMHRTCLEMRTDQVGGLRESGRVILLV